MLGITKKNWKQLSQSRTSRIIPGLFGIFSECSGLLRTVGNDCDGSGTNWNSPGLLGIISKSWGLLRTLGNDSDGQERAGRVRTNDEK